MLADLDMGNFDLANLSVAGGVLKYGTWIPTLSDGSWSGGSEDGIYARIGKMVFCIGQISRNTVIVPPADAAVVIGNLPVAVGTNGGTGIITSYSDIVPTGSAPFNIAPVAASTTASTGSAGGTAGFRYGDFGASPAFTFMFAYTA